MKRKKRKTNVYIDMPKRCPPGVLCIENYTIFTIFCILIVTLAYIFVRDPEPENNSSAHKKINKQREPEVNIYDVEIPQQTVVRANPRFGFNNNEGDILLNPYVPPLSDERYIIPSRDVRSMNIGGFRGIPINIRTQGFDSAYRQVGILTSQTGKGEILALMGRPLLSNREKWQYYTMSERNNIKLPISVKGKSCMNEYGCDKVYDGDTVYVEGYGNIFRATIYDNDVMRYIPFV
jgi:hypothetical protein